MSPRQLPAYSPLPCRAIVNGLEAALTRDEVFHREVRRALRERYGPDDLILTDSGTTALTLALRAVREQLPEGPVAIPAYSCYDVATAAVGANVPVRLYDLAPRTLGPDPSSLGEAVADGAVAVVVAHLYGIPADMGEVLEVAEGAGLPVVEDAAQAGGGVYRGRLLGTFGSLSVLSFGRGKGTTGCGGGALLANDARGQRFLSRVREILPDERQRGWSQGAVALGQWLFGRPILYSIPSSLPFLRLGETVYREPEPPGRISDVSLGILGVTTRLEDRELGIRRRRARHLYELTRSASGLTPIEPPTDARPGYLRFPVLANAAGVARELSGDAAESLGVMPGYPKPLYRLRAMKGLCRDALVDRPGAREITRRLYTLPTHSQLGRTHDHRLAGFVESVEKRQRRSGDQADPLRSRTFRRGQL